MSIKKSIEQRIMDYFEESPLEVSQTVFQLVKAKLKKREEASVPSLVKQPKRRTKKRTVVTSEASEVAQ